MTDRIQSCTSITATSATSDTASRATEVMVMLSRSRMPLTFWLICAAR